MSAARLNQKTRSMLTGAQIAALSPTYPGEEVFCTSTGSGFTIDTTYTRNSANNAWITSSVGKHKHDADVDSAGGLYSDILLGNFGKYMLYHNPNPSIGEFHQDTASGGTLSNDFTLGRINFSTGTTSGAYAQLGKHGVPVSFASASKFKFMGYCTVNTQVSVRMGVAMETVYATTTTTRKYGIEGCDSAGTARNYEVICANGSVRSNVTSSQDMARSSDDVYHLEFTPGVNVKFYVDGIINTTNSSNIPNSGASSGVLNVGMGVRTNNTSSKNLFMRGISFVGLPGDSTWSGP